MQNKFMLAVLIFCVLAGALTAAETPLEWLAKSQEPDGHWNAKKWSASKQTDTIVTSLSLLAFLGPGHSEKVGQFKDNVKRSVAWLKSKQDASGKVFWTDDAKGLPDEAYATALSTLALCEAAAMADVPATKEAAQKAVNYCADVFPLKSKTPGDENAEYVLDKSIDLPILGWYVMAFKSAKIAGLKVPHGVFDALILYLDSVEHEVAKPAAGGAVPASEYWYRPDQKSSDLHPAHRLSAIGCMCRQFLGWKREELKPSVEYFLKQSGLPEWSKAKDNVDLYYWYISEMSALQQGGHIWKNWFEALRKALWENQRKDGDDAASWDPKGGVGLEWGRLGQTALACLCLEVRFRPVPLANPNK